MVADLLPPTPLSSLSVCLAQLNAIAGLVGGSTEVQCRCTEPPSAPSPVHLMRADDIRTKAPQIHARYHYPDVKLRDQGEDRV